MKLTIRQSKIQNPKSTITKRVLGIIIIVGGVAVVAVTVGVDLVGAGRWSGFGPVQIVGVLVGGLAIVLGIPLLFLGNRPA